MRDRPAFEQQVDFGLERCDAGQDVSFGMIGSTGMARFAIEGATR